MEESRLDKIDSWINLRTWKFLVANGFIGSAFLHIYLDGDKDWFMFSVILAFIFYAWESIILEIKKSNK